MSCDRTRFVRTLSVMALLFSAVVFCYYPGLYGDYVFDDISNILDNSKIAIYDMEIATLVSAAFSGDAGPLGRPLSMLSFGINHYFSGFDAFYYKLTNLVIHFFNAVFVFFISKQTLPRMADMTQRQTFLFSFLVALLWGLHPINLTSVLYVVQRMVTLSSLFGLGALYVYGRLRSSEKKVRLLGVTFHLLAVVLLLLASMLSKESGALFIPLLLLQEFFVYKGRSQGEPLRIKGYSLIAVLSVFSILGCLFALAYVPKLMNPSAFMHRDFNAAERILTELRVVFYYLKLFFYPRLTELSLYHDDFIVSKSLIQPVTTLYALIGFGCISLVCIALLRKLPILLFAWCWFLIGHSLESTVISLELVHEHRNYFAVIGLVLVFPILYLHASRKIKPFLLVLCFAYLGYLGLTTWQRAAIWSNLVDHARFEAVHHPNSDRSNYQLARVYMKLMEQHVDEEGKMFFACLANESLSNARESYQPANGGWFAHIHLSYYLGKEPDQEIIDELKSRLATLPFYNSNVGFLSGFANCQIGQHCKLPHHEAVQIFAAAAENPNIGGNSKAEVLKLTAQYFAEVAGDFKKAEEFLLDALEERNDVNGNLLLAQVYRGKKDIGNAKAQLERAKLLDRKGVWFREIQYEEAMIDELLGQQSEREKSEKEGPR